jgi:hypothetical protein
MVEMCIKGLHNNEKLVYYMERHLKAYDCQCSRFGAAPLVKSFTHHHQSFLLSIFHALENTKLFPCSLNVASGLLSHIWFFHLFYGLLMSTVFETMPSLNSGTCIRLALAGTLTSLTHSHRISYITHKTHCVYQSCISHVRDSKAILLFKRLSLPKSRLSTI